MAGSIYFLKARIGSDAATFSCGWAERVRRIAGRLQAENIQVPVVSLRNERWELQGHRLLPGLFDGFAYACRPPGWYVSDRPAALPGFAEASRIALEERLRTTPLGRMCLHPEVRLALAQDRLAATLEPVLRLPDLLAGEDELAEAWRIERPEAAAEAATAADRLVPAREARTAHGRWRRRLRVAALRRLDAAAMGREVFRPCPAYFGEPYLPIPVTPEFSLKAGLVRRMKTWPNSGGEARSRAWRTDDERIGAMEQGLFPGLAGGAGEPGANARLVLWLALAPVRDFETRSPWPLFPRAQCSADGPPPAGFSVRIRPETMRSLGGSYRTLATAGLSPYLAGPLADYCATQRELLAEWSEDAAGLAQAKWGRG